MSEEKDGKANQPVRRHGRAAAATTLALLTAASVTVGGIFDSPAAILNDEPDAAVCAVADDGGDDADAGEESGEKVRSRAGVRASAREAILRLPLAVRLLVILPLWLIGWTVTTLGSALLASPIGQAVLNVALIAIVLLALYAAAVKTIFPDLPLRKILNRRSVAGVVLAAAVLGAADAVLPLVWAEYEKARRAVYAVGTLAILGAAVTAFSLREQKRRLRKKQQAAARTETPERVEFVDPGGDSFVVDLRRAGKV